MDELMLLYISLKLETGHIVAWRGTVLKLQNNFPWLLKFLRQVEQRIPFELKQKLIVYVWVLELTLSMKLTIKEKITLFIKRRICKT